jgi:hypothetical protein
LVLGYFSKELSSIFVIIDASAAVIDVSVKFEGQTEAVYTATAAYASSLVNASTSTLISLSAKPAKAKNENKKLQVIKE